MNISAKMRCLVLVCVLLGVSAVGEEQWCSYVDSTNFPYVQDFECPVQGNNIYVWENCTVGDVLFTVNSSDILVSDEKEECGGYLVLSEDRLNITLGQALDAERQGRPLTCYITVNSAAPTYINPLDINEFAPLPEDNIGVTEVNMKENQPNTQITNFTYIDDDEGETETLKWEWISTEFQNQFDMTQDENSFILSTIDALDYETRSVYKMEFNIISTDKYETTKSATHTVLLFVLDEGDTAPYWTHLVPTANLPEGPADRFVYYVSAADRDFGINNEVKYNITEGNEDGFFSIDESSGNVTLVKEIDYEKDPKFFTLTVTAQEYLEDDQKAPDPSSSVTITNIYIDDVNDEIPTFNRESYEQTIDEVVSSPVLIDVDMFVCDADSAKDFSKYTITADKVDYLRIEPSESRDNTTIRLWALETTGVFDYEKTEKQPIEIALKATELADPTHTQTVSLTIRLNDKNDKTPTFQSEIYDVSIPESEGKGSEVITVSAYDGDKSPQFGNDSIRYSVLDCSNQLEVDDVSGIVTLVRDGALNYEEETNIVCKIRARDGDVVDYHTSECTVNITVIDVNDSPPTLTFEFQKVTVVENSPKGTVLDVRINASDPDTTASLSFDIDWAGSTAHKDGVEVTIEKVKKWFVVEKIANGEAAEAALEVGAKTPDREFADTVRLSIKVTDDNTAPDLGYLDKVSEILEIQILDENDTPPEFVGDYSDLKVLENSEEGTTIVVVEASDADEKDAVTFSINDDAYINITQQDDFSAELVVSGKTLIDREAMETIEVIITIEDRNSHSKDQKFTVAVTDENDNAPTFLDDIIFASFTPYDKIGNSLRVILAKDDDQNEDLNFQLENDFEWPDGGLDPPPTVPFRLQNKEGNDAELLLNFDPLGVSNGYCNFTITCLDNDGKHNASVKGKVYAITSDFEVAVNYDNPVSDIREQFMPIQNAFGEVYGFPSSIDSITDGEDDTKSVVKMHFIDGDKNEPVEASRIIEMSNEYAVSQALIAKNEELGLNIVSVGNVTPDQGGGEVNNVLILEIVLGIVSLVLGSLLMLLLITYFIRTRSLERKLKVATTTTFGSVASDLNRMDMGSGVPGSNKFAGEGANPMYNLSENYLRNDDASSVGSGDSVLVGVEDNPEFRGYSADTNKAPKGQSNPAFNRSIDDIAAPSPFSGGTRTNPLMGLDMDDEGSGDLADALRNHDLFIRRRSEGSEAASGYSDGVDQNPNFSFK